MASYSRYKGLNTFRLPNKDKQEEEVYELRLNSPPPSQWTGDVHTVMEGDTVASISYKYYGTEKLWWKIMDVNCLQMPLDLRVGQTLRIPPFEEATKTMRKKRNFV
ncbi:MAG: LysM domain-containing protein [Planctomycetota bacterium]|nr:MAG: LysM domain-containing protein [Planctomycetota bacterium]